MANDNMIAKCNNCKFCQGNKCVNKQSSRYGEKNINISDCNDIVYIYEDRK